VITDSRYGSRIPLGFSIESNSIGLLALAFPVNTIAMAAYAKVEPRGSMAGPDVQLARWQK
jgi:hypothetical protein